MCMRQSLISPNRIQSPLNYTGGKFRLLPQIQPLFPANIDVLVDLFCGGGNVGINTPAERIVLNDSDKNVMRIFRLFRQYPTEQILEIIDGIIDRYGLSDSRTNGYAFYQCESARGLGTYNKEGYNRLRSELNNMKRRNDRYFFMLFTLIVCAMALPKQVILIPLLREMSSLNLYNTIWAVIFPIVGWPFGVFLMKQFSEGIPTEMLEAARIDGASEARTFVKIVLPMVKPGIGALAIFTFINSWNDYFMQLIMLSSTSNLTISLGIAKLQAENSTDFGLIMAGAALAAVPIIIIFLIFQKYFTKGIAMGAVKG